MDLDLDELGSSVYASSVGSIGPQPDFSFGTNPFPLVPHAHPAKPAAQPAGPKPKVSHARKTPEGHVKRPPNAFILFRSHCCAPTADPDQLDAPGTPTAQQLQDLGITDHRHISRIVSHLWKSLSPEEKGYWETKAQFRKTEHQRLHPDYKYKPVYRSKDAVKRRRKGDQETRIKEERGCEDVARALLDQPLRSTSEERSDRNPDNSTAPDSITSSSFEVGNGRTSAPAEVNTVHIARPSSSSGLASRPPLPLAPKTWTIDVVREALATGRAPPAPDPLPKKKRGRHPRPGRPSRAKDAAAVSPSATASQEPGASGEAGDSVGIGPGPNGVSEEMMGLYTAYQPDLSGSKTYFSSQTSSRAASPSPESQFSYMAQLDVLQQSVLNQHRYSPDVRPFTSPVHPARPSNGYEHLDSYAMETSHSQPQYGIGSVPAVGGPHDVPYNPPFLYAPPAGIGHHHPTTFTMPFPDQDQSNLPLSPSSVAIRQMQHYNLSSPPQTAHGSPVGGFGAGRAGPASGGLPLGVPVPGSSLGEAIAVRPTGTTFAYSAAEPGSSESALPALSQPGLGLSAARSQAAVEDVGANLSLLGLKRRNTLRGTNGGDLMLISPITGTFGGRRYSLGRYEVRRFSTQQLAAVAEDGRPDRARSSLATELSGAPTADLGMLDFEDSFLNDIINGTVPQAGEFGEQYTMQRTLSDQARPNTAVSSYSSASDASSASLGTSPPVERQVDSDASMAFWRRQQEHHQQQQQQQFDQDGEPLPIPSYHVAGQDYFVSASPVRALTDYHAERLAEGEDSGSPQAGQLSVPVFDSAGFGNFFDPSNHRQSIDALLAASATDNYYAAHYAYNAHDWLSRGARGSDATIRPVHRDSLAHGAGALEGGVLYEEDLRDPVPYYYLTKEESQNRELVDRILAHGYGVGYDAEPGEETRVERFTVPFLHRRIVQVHGHI